MFMGVLRLAHLRGLLPFVITQNTLRRDLGVIHPIGGQDKPTGFAFGAFNGLLVGHDLGGDAIGNLGWGSPFLGLPGAGIVPMFNDLKRVEGVIAPRCGQALGLGKGIFGTAKVGLSLLTKGFLGLLTALIDLLLDLLTVTLNARLIFNPHPRLGDAGVGALHTGETIALTLTGLQGLGRQLRDSGLSLRER